MYIQNPPIVGGAAPDVPSTVSMRTCALTHSPEKELPMLSENRNMESNSVRLRRSPFFLPFRFVGIENVIVIVSKKL